MIKDWNRGVGHDLDNKFRLLTFTIGVSHRHTLSPNSVSLDTTLRWNRNNIRNSTLSACSFNVAAVRVTNPTYPIPTSYSKNQTGVVCCYTETWRTAGNSMNLLRSPIPGAIQNTKPRVILILRLEMTLHEPSASREPGSSLVGQCKIQLGKPSYPPHPCSSAYASYL